MAAFRGRAIALLLIIALIFAASQLLSRAPAGERKAIEISSGAVSSKMLSNGLVILARRSLPEGLVAIDVKILAGSSLEGEYLASGVSHLVEHMVFKGTPERPAGAIEREVKSYGGIINGSTSSDITDYHILIPSANLPEGLAILKDMLSNAAFDQTEFDREKEVVLKEIDLNDDEPYSNLLKRLDEAAYLRHPYKYPTIGYKDRLQRLSREDAVSFYKKMYRPDRMVLSIVGDVDPQDAISEASSLFGDLGPSDYAQLPQPNAEPVQLGQRRLDEDSRVNLAYLAIGFHSTGLLDKDLFAMDVLSMILGRGDNSRLNKELLKKDRIVYSISAWNNTPRDPGMFVIAAMLDKSNAVRAEKAILAQIDKLRRGAISEAELGAARRMALADAIASLETVDGQASDIGYSYIMTGGPDFSRRYLEGIQNVTKGDIKRVALKYLDDENMTVVRLLPDAGTQYAPPDQKAPAQEVISKETLPNGLRILIHTDHRTPAVSIAVVMMGGVMVETEADNGISNITAQMLLKGTAARGEDRISGHIESLGGSAEPFSGLNSFGLRIRVLKNDVTTALDILKDVLSNSKFSADELTKVKELTLASIKEEDDDIFGAGLNALRKAIYGRSPYGLRYLGTAASVNALNREDLIRFFAKYGVAGNMVISISGDVDAKTAFDAVKGRFSDIGKEDVAIPIPAGEKLSSVAYVSLDMDKKESLALIGFETTSVRDEGKYALDLLGSLLSGSSGKIFDRIRNKLAMAYALGCSQKLGLGRGYFAFYAATTRENIDDARKALFDEIANIRKGSIKDEELLAAKKELIFGRRVDMQSNDFISITSALDELYGLGHDNLYRYAASIEKVSGEDVTAAANKYFDPGACAQVTILSTE